MDIEIILNTLYRHTRIYVDRDTHINAYVKLLPVHGGGREEGGARYAFGG